jgi:hypothetical protein
VGAVGLGAAYRSEPSERAKGGMVGWPALWAFVFSLSAFDTGWKKRMGKG